MTRHQDSPLAKKKADSLAKNEGLYRRVNEEIESISDAVPHDEPRVEFLCECDRPECSARVAVTRAEYETVRAVSTHFLVYREHVDTRVERAVFSTDRFAVVEKQGEAAREAAKDDPRT